MRTLPSTGPMQGVQAKAKAIPMTGGAQAPRTDGRTLNRFSPDSATGRATPAAMATRTAPNTTIRMPETTSSVCWWARKSRPSEEAEAPRMVKTTVNPAMKARIPRSRRARCRRSSSGSGASPVACPTPPEADGTGSASGAIPVPGPGAPPTGTGRTAAGTAATVMAGAAAGAMSGTPAGATAGVSGRAVSDRSAVSSAADSPDTMDR